MPKPPPPPAQPADSDDASLEDSFYEVPADLEAEETVRAEPTVRRAPPADEDEPDLRPIRRGVPTLQIGIALGVILVVLSAVVVYRTRERHRAVRDGLERSEQLVRQGTADGYREAARFLEKLNELDPSKSDALEVASARAFALAMLATDYGDAHAETEANALLVDPSRARAKPPRAALAFAALRLSTNALGDATSELDYAGDDDPWAKVMKARVALRAGTPEAAVDPAAAAAAESGFAPGLAIHGDAVRRARRDGATARSAYEAALAASPTEPRATYGLAKLALAGQAPSAEAAEALQRLAADAKTPAPERARAALHLVALRLRAGHAEPEVPLDDPALGLDEPARVWARRAAAAEAGNKGSFKAVIGAPPGLTSQSDDDPAELRPFVPPPPPPPPPEPRPAVKPASHAKAGKAAKAPTTRPAAKASKASAKPKSAAKGKATAAASKKTAAKPRRP